MAAGMNHSMQTAQHLCVMTQSQMMDEDKIDPFPARTTAELEEMCNACRRTKEILARESLIYSSVADFSKYSDQELLAMNAFVKESSRMLSIILAGGQSHFWRDSGVMSTLQELKNMYHYIDDKVKDFFMMDMIMDTLDFKVRYGHKVNVNSSKTIVLSGHPELSRFIPLDDTKGVTSQETLNKIADLCDNFAKQCRTIATTRAAKFEDRGKKVAVREKLLGEIDTVVPFLRQHVLRIGISKSQLKEDSSRKNGNQATTEAKKITSLFTHKAVEEAHLTVEDCRERLVQEQLFRRAKVERRLEMEEEREKQGARFISSEELMGMPAYAGVMPDQTQKPKGKKADNASREGSESPTPGQRRKSKADRHPNLSGGDSPRSGSEASPKSRQRMSVRAAKGEEPQLTKAVSKDLNAPQRGVTPRQESPPPAKTPSKGGTKADSGKQGYPDKGRAKAASPTKGRESPTKGRDAGSPNSAGSPKARSRPGRGQ